MTSFGLSSNSGASCVFAFGPSSVTMALSGPFSASFNVAVSTVMTSACAS